MADVGFSCDCGALEGVLHDVNPGNVCHLICYCRDCRAFARHMGQLKSLEPGGGSPLVQVLPARIELTAGREHIACLKLSPKGLHRWYAACCKTPLANTVATSKIPLAGMWRHNFSSIEGFGPVVTLGFTKMAQSGGPRRDKGLYRMLGGLAKRSLASFLAGNMRRNPFFAADGMPVVAPVVLTKSERVAAYSE
ncbi:MAG: DUF6151 family protein [Roseobacter sp.]